MLKHISNNPIQRRQFLKMASSAGIGTSILRSSPLIAGMMYNRFVEAAEDAKRAFLIYYPGGAPGNAWFPSSISAMNAASEPYADVAYCCNFHNVTMIGGGHGFSSGGMGGGGGNTIDTQLANIIGSDTPYTDINLGYDVGNTHDIMGRINGQPKKPEENPQQAYKQLFGGPPPGGAAQALYDKQKIALDANKIALDALKKKFGQHELERLETHLDALSKLDKRLADAAKFVPPEGCSEPQFNLQSPSMDAAEHLKLMADIGITAMRCGLTNVVTIQLSTSQCDWRYNGSFSEGHHQTLHGRGHGDQVEIKRYLSSVSAYIIQQLIDTPDPTGGTMIDKTVFCETTDFGNGASHSSSNSPWLVATKRPEFDTGNVINGGTSTAVLDGVLNSLTA